MSSKFELRIFDRFDLSSASKNSSSLPLSLVKSTLTLGEVIALRVEVELEAALLSNKNSTFLTDEKRWALLVDNSGAKTEEELKNLQESALNAFEINGYFVVYDDQQLTSLDAVVDVRKSSTLEFYRLPPLVGG
ncbi:hypothetical protein [Corallincola spongiicola]|uniref:Uncharacterized protein n=1 Tax=Corallincola spongiicola TaxID=2520508 RepID=A0ABY1WSX2_9GAMM|nr:hypothetical protein [Corallincola spongiicola]TAA47844.1 hypothetical protein EXY25_00920 [Corallincola spongiicola]